MKPPEQIVLFIDRALGKKIIAERLRAEGARVEIHDDHFSQACVDEEWLTEVGTRGWVVLTKDKHFQRRELEVRAITNANVRVFQLTAGNIQGTEMAEVFSKALTKIRRIAVSNRPPFIAKITRTGVVQLVYSRRKLKRRYTP